MEQVTSPDQAERLLEQWRAADHVSLLALPDLTGVMVDWETGADTAGSAELFFSRYQGDWNALLGALFSADIKKVSHNVKDLMRALLENGLPAEGFIFDTALAAYLLDATAGSYDLQRLFVSYYNTELMKPLYLEPDAFSPLGDTLQAETAFHCHTSAVDALYGTLAPKLREKQLWDLYETAELPLCRVLAEMETAGCRVDKGALVAFGEMLSANIAAREKAIYDMAGRSSTSTPPSSWGRSCSASWACPTAKRRKPAGPPTPTCWRSSGTRPPSWGRCWSTASTPS